jgi:hypothetical protein
MRRQCLLAAGAVALFVTFSGSAWAPTLDLACARDCRLERRAEIRACRSTSRNFRQYFRCVRRSIIDYRDCLRGCRLPDGPNPEDGPL